MILAANFKLHLHTKSDIEQYFSEFFKGLGHALKTRYVFFPQATVAPYMNCLNGKIGVHWGAQNIAHEPKGAFTGEVSIEAFKALGASYVLIGHSERRSHETPDTLLKKLLLTQSAGLVPVFCVGENAAQRSEPKGFEDTLDAQLSVLDGCNKSAALWVAYEPVWAIGTGKVADLEQVEHAGLYIKSALKAFTRLSVLYGGSVSASNIQTLKKAKPIDGFLVGSTSLSPKKFRDLAAQA